MAREPGAVPWLAEARLAAARDGACRSSGALKPELCAHLDCDGGGVFYIELGFEVCLDEGFGHEPPEHEVLSMKGLAHIACFSSCAVQCVGGKLLCVVAYDVPTPLSLSECKS